MNMTTEKLAELRAVITDDHPLLDALQAAYAKERADDDAAGAVGSKQDFIAYDFFKAGFEACIPALLDALAERALESQEAIPADCDVRKIMLRVDPGSDGMGVEVYARNVGDVEALLSDLGGKTEEAYASKQALEPQGQELPELPEPDDRIGNGLDDVRYDADSVREYGQKCYDAGRASQLALPAGPVPAQGKFFLLDPAGYSHPEIFDTEEERDAAAKDAIMDHLDDGWSEEVENIVCGVITHEATKVDVRHRPAEGTPEYDEWPDHSFDEMCNYEMRPVSSPAVAQPVADERAEYERMLRAGYQHDNVRRQERGLASSDELTQEQEREIAERVALKFPSDAPAPREPIAFSCAKRAAYPTSWTMTCDKHCGDGAKCLRAAPVETSAHAALCQPAEEGGES